MPCRRSCLSARHGRLHLHFGHQDCAGRHSEARCDLAVSVYGLPSHKTDHPVLQQVETDLKTPELTRFILRMSSATRCSNLRMCRRMRPADSIITRKLRKCSIRAKVRDSFVRLIKEVVALADKMGIPLESRPGSWSRRNLRILDVLAPTASTSMQRDMEAGKQSEVDGLILSGCSVWRSSTAWMLPGIVKSAEAVKTDGK